MFILHSCPTAEEANNLINETVDFLNAAAEEDLPSQLEEVREILQNASFYSIHHVGCERDQPLAVWNPYGTYSHDVGGKEMNPPNIPNFDAMTRDELRSFWSEYHICSKSKAVELLGVVRKDGKKIVETLACYAMDRSVAMGYRLEGKIQQAIICENNAQLAYNRLPSVCRW
jgi:hypothetical protein